MNRSLQWPPGWKRTPDHLKHYGGQFSHADPYGALEHELRMLGATQVVISTDPIDTGVAVYFNLKGEHRVMACDRFITQRGNMRSVGLAVQAMRQLERHGGGDMADRAFAGFAALPPPRLCWEVLGIDPASNLEEIQRAFRAKALKHHPDRGGSDKAMAELSAARDEAITQIA